MAKNVMQQLDLSALTTLSDKGYTTGEQLDKCAKNGNTTFSSPKDSASNHNGLFNVERFAYTPENDSYTCPAKQQLTSNGTSYKKGNYCVKHYKTKACKSCALRQHCTNNKNGRFIERSEHQKVVDDNRDRVNTNPDYYRQRQQITEHQFGTLKRQWGFTYTLMKGKQAVLAEAELLMIIYNLRRCMSILGPNNLKIALKTLASYFLTKSTVCSFFKAISQLFLRMICIRMINSKFDLTATFKP